MKSDVIRKRSRHDARRAGGPIEQTPSTSPGASRRASPANDNAATPTFAPDSTTQTSGYDYDYSHTSQSELMNALTGNSTGYTSSYSLSSYTSGVYPGPWNPELLKEVQPAPAEALPFSGVEQAEADDAHDQRASKRRRMSNVSTVSSGTEPPLSAASYGSYDSGFGSGSSSLAGSGAAPLPQFPYASYSSFNLMRGSNPTGGFWPAAARSPATFVHPPMLPPDDGAMDYASMNLAPVSAPAHHGHDETDYALFSTYLHPPMLPPDSPQHGLATLQPQHHLHQHHQAHLHPPMLPPDFGGGADVFNESGIASY
jgi:GATA-binding protein